MDKFTYRTKGVCSSAIDITVDENVIQKVQYHGGCSGNTQGVSALVIGMKPEEAIKKIKGIRCGLRPTSCPDQLARALEGALVEPLA